MLSDKSTIESNHRDAVQHQRSHKHGKIQSHHLKRKNKIDQGLTLTQKKYPKYLINIWSNNLIFVYLYALFTTYLNALIRILGLLRKFFDFFVQLGIFIYLEYGGNTHTRANIYR